MSGPTIGARGGVFALFSLLPRRTATFTFLALLGAALLFGDGIITPAISVLSAVEGLSVVTPAFDPFILPLTVAILLLLFSLQRWGSGRLGVAFGRVMELWFFSLAILGIVGILHEPGVLVAAHPLHAIRFFEANGSRSLLTLGAVVLCVTGAEAIYADLGHFGRSPVRRAWVLFVFPALLLNYAGQAAMVLHAPEVGHTFFALIPGPLLYPMVALATLAAVIASQAVISGIFSLARQATQLGFLPRLRIIHTSRERRGQIYLPWVNRILGASCIGAVLLFRDSRGLAAAYGVAVTANMLITSLVFASVARGHFRWSPLLVLPLVSLFLAFELPYFAANLLKLVDGGWLPLLIAASGVLLMLTWSQGRRALAVEVVKRSVSIDLFMDRLRAAPLGRVRGTAVFLSSSPSGVPPELFHPFRDLGVLYEKLIFFTAVAIERPFVKEAERVDLQSLGEGVFRVIAYHGYMETPNAPASLRRAKEKGLPIEIEDLRYFLGRKSLLPTGTSTMPAWRKKLFLLLSRNAATASTYLRIPPEKVVELGMEIEI